MEKLYFGNESDEFCYNEKYFQNLMIETNSDSCTVYEAEKEKIEGVFFCKEFQEWGDKGEGTCGILCDEYSPRNGKSGCCRHYSNINYSAGKEVILNFKNK